MNALKEKFYVRESSSGTWEDFATKFNGLRILSIEGLNGIGKALNVYHEQWINTQEEDFTIASSNNTIIRENMDIEMVYVISPKYMEDDTVDYDTMTIQDNFMSFISSKALYIASTYVGKSVYCAMLDEFTPTTQKLKRGSMEYILGTIKLHTLNSCEAFSI